MKASGYGKRLALALGCVCATHTSAAPPPPPPQDSLKPVVNAGMTDETALHFDWPMLRIGTGEYEEGPTGVTVFRFGRKVHAAVDARGGGPGTVNAEYLQLGWPQPEVDTVVLSGGSWYGLESVTAVNSGLIDEGYRGGHWDNVGLSVGSIIYDFGGRRLNEIYPDKRLARAALGAVQAGVFPIGPYGAGRSAVSGGLFGCNAHSGQGAAFRQVGDLKIAVFTVVNALGVVTRRDGSIAACYRDKSWPQSLKTSDLLAGLPDSKLPGWAGASNTALERKNTTISLVVINQALHPSELQRLAVQVHTSMARSIQPFATEFDGDVLYAVSTAEIDPAEGKRTSLVDIGMIASEMMWDAILSAVPDQPPLPVPTATPFPVGNLDAYAGDYRFSQFATLNVTTRDGKLYGQATGGRKIFLIGTEAPVELKPVSPGEFAVAGRYPMLLRFDGKGGLVINPGRWQQVTTRRRR